LAKGLEKCKKLLRGGKFVATPYELFDFCPIHRRQIETQPDPSFRPNVCRKIELAGVALDKPPIIAGKGFATEANDSIAMMIVEIVDEYLLPDEKAGMFSLIDTRCLGKRETYPGQPGQSYLRLRFQSHADLKHSSWYSEAWS